MLVSANLTTDRLGPTHLVDRLGLPNLAETGGYLT